MEGCPDGAAGCGLRPAAVPDGFGTPDSPATEGTSVARFSVLSLVGHAPHPLTGELHPVADRFHEVIETGVAAEGLGFDAYAVGERHAGPFLSSSPGVVLGAPAARTTTIRLLTGVTVVAILDPVRVAEDFATLDQIARGRVELVVGKGAEAGHFSLFGLDEARQWDLQREKYELLRRLRSEEGVDWEGEFRPGRRGGAGGSRPRSPAHPRRSCP